MYIVIYIFFYCIKNGIYSQIQTFDSFSFFLLNMMMFVVVLVWLSWTIILLRYIHYTCVSCLYTSYYSSTRPGSPPPPLTQNDKNLAPFLSCLYYMKSSCNRYLIWFDLIWFKGTDRLCKVVELSMQCCGQIL